MEEESYFNGPDDDDDPLSLDSIMGSFRANAASGPSRKRESEMDDAGRKKAKTAGTLGESGGVSQSSVALGEKGGKGKGRGLVDYGDDSDEEISPGGFIREDAAADADHHPLVVDPAVLSPATTSPPSDRPKVDEGETPDSAPVPAAPPPALSEPPPRRKVEEDDDELGLLSAASKLKKSPLPPSSSSTSRPATLSMSTSLAVGSKAKAVPKPIAIAAIKFSTTVKTANLGAEALAEQGSQEKGEPAGRETLEQK